MSPLLEVTQKGLDYQYCHLYYTGSVTGQIRCKMLLTEKPTNSFTMLDNKVLKLPISDGARILYWTYMSLKPGKNYSDKYLSLVLNINNRTLLRRKAELRDHDLLYVHQVASTVYFTFVGTTAKPASMMFAEWKSKVGRVGKGEKHVD